MDDDHVGSQELLATGHPLADRLSVVHHELEVEIGDPGAGIAPAGCRLLDVSAAATEPEIAAFDRVEEHRPIDSLGRHEREGGIALELGKPEIGPERRDDRADEVREDVLGVAQLDVGEIAGVPGDVGDQETGCLRD